MYLLKPAMSGSPGEGVCMSSLPCCLNDFDERPIEYPFETSSQTDIFLYALFAVNLTVTTFDGGS